MVQGFTLIFNLAQVDKAMAEKMPSSYDVLQSAFRILQIANQFWAFHIASQVEFLIPIFTNRVSQV